MVILIAYIFLMVLLSILRLVLIQPRVEMLGLPRSGKWRTIRNNYLQSNPYCAICGSKENLSVHHIKSFSENPELELCCDNLITLCENKNLNCHFVFGHHMKWTNLNGDLVENLADIRRMVKGNE